MIAAFGEEKLTVRTLVKSFYDLQKLRVMTGNRIVGNVRIRLGQVPGKPTEELSPEAIHLLDSLADAYKLIADAMAEMITASMKRVTPLEVLSVAEGVITNEAEYMLVGHYLRLQEQEVTLQKAIGRAIEDVPIYVAFLDGVKGCGPLMSAVCISELDPYKARHVSSFWKYAGLDVGPDGAGRSRRAEHLVKVQYINKDGEEDERNSITFNPFLKTKLIGVLASSFLRCGSPYAAIYYDYKARIENHPAHVEKTKLQRHNMALRYMIKMFLKDLWLAWRQVEGLPVTPDYAEAKLAMVHGAKQS